MSEVTADLDGIRQLGDLLHRQSQHVAAMANFLQEHCSAAGAFDGVLLLLRPTYSKAFGYATEGLEVSRDANQMLAERCEKTAENYEKADNDNYIAFARLASAYQMTVSPYRTAGSGLDKVPPGGPFAPPEKSAPGGGLWEKVDKLSETMTGAITPVTGPADSVVDAYESWVKPTTDAWGKVSAKTVEWNGEPVLADRLERMHNRLEGPDGTRFVPDEPVGFDKWHGAQDERLKAAEKFVDPTKALKKDLVDKASERLELGGNYIDNAATQHRLAEGMAWTNNAVDTYSTAKSIAEDPTLGARGLLDEAHEAFDAIQDVGRYAGIANDEVDDSVARELRESR